MTKIGHHFLGKKGDTISYTHRVTPTVVIPLDGIALCSGLSIHPVISVFLFAIPF